MYHRPRDNTKAIDSRERLSSTHDYRDDDLSEDVQPQQHDARPLPPTPFHSCLIRPLPAIPGGQHLHGVRSRTVTEPGWMPPVNVQRRNVSETLGERRQREVHRTVIENELPGGPYGGIVHHSGGVVPAPLRLSKSKKVKAFAPTRSGTLENQSSNGPWPTSSGYQGRRADFEEQVNSSNNWYRAQTTSTGMTDHHINDKGLESLQNYREEIVPTAPTQQNQYQHGYIRPLPDLPAQHRGSEEPLLPQEVNQYKNGDLKPLPELPTRETGERRTRGHHHYSSASDETSLHRDSSEYSTRTYEEEMRVKQSYGSTEAQNVKGKEKMLADGMDDYEVREFGFQNGYEPEEQNSKTSGNIVHLQTVATSDKARELQAAKAETVTTSDDGIHPSNSPPTLPPSTQHTAQAQAQAPAQPQVQLHPVPMRTSGEGLLQMCAFTEQMGDLTAQIKAYVESHDAKLGFQRPAFVKSYIDLTEKFSSFSKILAKGDNESREVFRGIAVNRIAATYRMLMSGTVQLTYSLQSVTRDKCNKTRSIRKQMLLITWHLKEAVEAFVRALATWLGVNQLGGVRIGVGEHIITRLIRVSEEWVKVEPSLTDRIVHSWSIKPSPEDLARRSYSDS